MTQYNVRIDSFEGPLDLLLHLINRYEIDINDIPVAQITEQYLEYIHTMQELQLDLASEYLVMAATLLAIKSNTLLPQQEEEELEHQLTGELEEDPREELVRRLLEYRKFKEASSYLKEREIKKSLAFTKSPSKWEQIDLEPDNLVADTSVFDLMDAFQLLVKKKKKSVKAYSTIHRQEVRIETRMNEIVMVLRGKQRLQTFQNLFPYPNREHLVVSFLAILELMKNQQIQCIQKQNFHEITIHLTEEDTCVDDPD